MKQKTADIEVTEFDGEGLISAERLKQTDLNEVPLEVVSDVICFCLANKQEDTEWVVLPVGNFDAYYGNAYFSRKWLGRIPKTILERSPQKSGICRIKLLDF